MWLVAQSGTGDTYERREQEEHLKKRNDYALNLGFRAIDGLIDAMIFAALGMMVFLTLLIWSQ